MKIKYKKVRKLKPIEASYIAGIIDGEGTITLTRRHRDENRHIAVTIDNTDFDLIKSISKIIGAGGITKKNPSNSRDNIAYVFAIYSRQALDLLAHIFPYLRTYKRERAKLTLMNYKKLTPRNGKYSPGILKKREKFIRDFFSITPPQMKRERKI